jgi:hypothetical protein
LVNPTCCGGPATVILAGDIKSGAGEEAPEDISKPKLHYAVQVTLHTDILEQLIMSGGRTLYAFYSGRSCPSGMTCRSWMVGWF